MPEPRTPVIAGLERHELVIGGPQNGQPQYLPLYALRSADGRVMSRWELTGEERERIAAGADVFIIIHTFNNPYQPTQVLVLHKDDEHLPPHFFSDFGLEARPRPRPAASDHRVSRGQPGATRFGHVHAEAFCLMTYRSDDGSVTEQLWNSRDGVTPFVVHSRDGVEMAHVDWQKDQYLPLFVPPVGTRIFVDLTPESAGLAAERLVERNWEHDRYPMRERYTTKEEAIEALAAEYLSQPGAPHVVEVSPELSWAFAERARAGLTFDVGRPSGVDGQSERQTKSEQCAACGHVRLHHTPDCHLGEHDSCSCPAFSEPPGGELTCPRREGEAGPWQRASDLDYWSTSSWGPYYRARWPEAFERPRTCSFCGCAHPEDAIRLIEAGWEIEESRKPWKLYLRPPSHRRSRQAVGEALPAGEQLPAAEHEAPVPPVKLYASHFDKGLSLRFDAALRDARGKGID